jgi:hypothetical protein
MKTTIYKLSAVLFACILGACSTVTVTTDYDKTTSFAKYRTYALASATQGQVLSPSSEAALRDALRAELIARGISEADKSKADLAVVRHVFLQEKVAVQQYTDWGYGYGGAWPYRYGSYSMWAGAPVTYTDFSEYTEGTLILDFVDRRTNKLVFRGIGRAVVEGPDSNARKIQEAVTKIVAELPVGKTH